MRSTRKGRHAQAVPVTVLAHRAEARKKAIFIAALAFLCYLVVVAADTGVSRVERETSEPVLSEQKVQSHMERLDELSGF